MKQSAFARISITLFLLMAMLSPTVVLAAAPDGRKHFKAGMIAEDAEQWDKAVEEFALAIVEDTKNPEYRLHYQRATFNASQMYMKKGAAQANEKDYVGAYDAFRRAYAYDPTNELAKSEMVRMLRLQKGLNPDDDSQEKTNGDATGVKLVPTGYQRTAATRDAIIPQKLEKLRNIPFPNGVDLQFIIRELAEELDLNVLFDEQSFRGRENQKIKIDLKNVSSAKALDYIFLQTGLFFQKVGPRTILIASQERRINFQQLVLRTFYLANADPAEVAKVVQFAIPPQQGRTPSQPLVDKATNSLTIRDTTENIRIIGNLINSLDKDRAEVVMDVQIYEVTKTDLLQLGNQIGTRDSLGNLGGTLASTFGNNEFGVTQAATSTAASIGAAPFGIGLIIPAVNLVALQDKQNTKLIASTQIHAFNNEDSSARIGKRVPVQSAQILGYNNGSTGTGGVNNGGLLGNAASVFNYEQTGLTLKFTPIVFPNQDVQVKMEIESKDVTGTASLNPTFTERTIKGTARIQNNKTLLLASVAQNSQSNGRTGLPLLGLIPILGRFFTAPKKDNNQTDIVIAVTPRVIRAPAILPEDEIERPTGSVAVPTSGSLEAMIIQDEYEEQLASARRLGNKVAVQLPDEKPEEPVYVRTNPSQNSETNAANNTETKSAETTAENKTENVSPEAAPILDSIKPIDTKVKTLQLAQTGLTSENKTPITAMANVEDAPRTNAPAADLQILPTLSEMKAGEKTKIAVMIKSATAFRSATLGLKFDQTKVAVRSVSYGEAFGANLAQTAAKPFVNENGRMFVTLAATDENAKNVSGTLAYVEIEALADGKPEITFVSDILSMMTADGKTFAVNY